MRIIADMNYGFVDAVTNVRFETRDSWITKFVNAILHRFCSELDDELYI